MFKALLLLPQGIAGAGTWLIWPIMGKSLLFQQADRKHLGPRAREWRGPPRPTQRNTSSARLEGSCAGSVAPNNTPWLPMCKQTSLLCTRQWQRGVRSFTLYQPSGTENRNTAACGRTVGSETSLH